MAKKLKIFTILLAILPIFSLLGLIFPVKAEQKVEQIGFIPGVVNGLTELIAGPSLETLTSSNASVQTPNGKVAGAATTDSSCGGKSAGEAYLICTNGKDASNPTGGNSGAIGVVGSLIDTMDTAKPASGVVYAQQRLNLFTSNATGQVYAETPASQAYFPGLGFNIIQPFQNMWAWARNISYGLFILIFLLIAFQILFRNKLEGQAPVTLANSIPNAMIALALVSLSYAITGLGIDAITLGTNVIKGVMQTIPTISGSPQEAIPNPDDFKISIWGAFNTATEQQAGQDVASGVGTIADNLSGQAALAWLLNILKSFLGTAIGGSLIELIFALAVLSAAFKLFLSLLRKYLVLLFNIIVSPFVFLLGATPGGLNKVILPYIRGIFATAATFVIIYAMFAFMIVFMRTDTIPTQVGYIPPLLGFDNSTGIPLNAIKALSAFGIFVTTPLIPDYVQKWFNAPDLSEILENISQSAIAGGQRALQLGGLGFQVLKGAYGLNAQRK